MPDIPTTDGAPSPEPTPDYGASHDEITQALDMYRGLNNLDTRGQYLQQVVRPEYDGQFLRQFNQSQEPEQAEDPWELYNQQYQEPEYQQQYEPQAPAFDPSTLPQALQPVFQSQKDEIVNEVFGRLNQMANDQNVRDSAAEAARASNLPPSAAALIEQRVREAQQLHPNRQAGDLAKEQAQTLVTELLQWKATPPATPAPTSAVPGGPSPSALQKPRTADEAMKYSLEVLNP